MAINYTWEINAVDVYPTLESHTNVIHNVRWRLEAVDTENQDAKGKNLKAGNSGNVGLDTTTLPNFIDFDSVTTAEVINWLEVALGNDFIVATKDMLQKDIESQITPTSVVKTLTS